MMVADCKVLVAIAPRWGANAHCVCGRLFDFRFPFGFTELTLGLRCRAKHQHGSAAPLAGLISFATAPFAAAIHL